MQFCWIITSKMNMRFLFTSFVSTMDIFAQGSTDRQVLGPIGPNRSENFKIFWVWFGPGPTGFGLWMPALTRYRY